MIGLFDSGIGGLTVLEKLRETFPKIKYFYLGDTARLPYGTKSSDTIRRYTEQNIQFLAKQGVTHIVSACHSASSALLQFNIQSPVPVFNVIEPSCLEAKKKTKNKMIGLLATQATVDAGQYQKLISQPFVLKAQACPLLVPLVEAGWTEDTITDQIISRYVAPLLNANVDTIILGCTHFPLLKNAIQKAVGPSVSLVDPGESLTALIQEKDLSNGGGVELFLTDTSPHFVKVAQKILNDPHCKISHVDL